jgi:multidrug efflux pump subunit AcrA (membrane-fusion protein)
MNAAWVAIALVVFGQVSAEAPPTATVPAPVQSTPSPGVTGDLTVGGTIKAQRSVDISAEVEGTLLKLPLREGALIAADQLLATIDDRHAQAAYDVAKIGLEAATAKAEDKIEEEYATAAAKVAEADLRKDLEVNQRNPGAVSDTEILKKKLDLTRSRLQIEKAKKDQVLAKLEADVKQAELTAAEVALERRTIKAPFAGEVQTLYQKEAQWVKPGDPILQLVRFDVMDVECYVNVNDFDPVEIANRPVSVTVNLARGRQATVEGRVVYVNQSVLPRGKVGGIYLVRAEVQNQKVGDYWVVRPGLEASMTIHTSRPPVEVAEARR